MVNAQDLTELEQQLVAAVLAGRPLVCGDSTYRIRAEVIRDLILGRHGDLDPRGLRIHGALVTGQLDLDVIHTANSVSMIRCSFEQPLLVGDAHLPRLVLSGSQVPGLYANSIRVGGDLILNDGFKVESSEPEGAVQLRGAQIGGLLDCGSAQLTNSLGHALIADNSRIDGVLLLDNGFAASGRGMLGATSMVDVHIGGRLDCTSARLTNPNGSALVANRIQVTGDLFFRGSFTATGRSEKSLIRLNSARLGGLDFDSVVRLENPEGPLLGLQNAATAWVRFPEDFVCASRDRVACVPFRHLLLNGFTYATLSKDGADWERWLHWVQNHTPNYTAQPYQQLASAQRSAGHDAATRRILIAQQDDLRVRGDLGSKWAKIRHRLWGALAGYGYRAGRGRYRAPHRASPRRRPGVDGWTYSNTRRPLCGLAHFTCRATIHAVLASRTDRVGY